MNKWEIRRKVREFRQENQISRVTKEALKEAAEKLGYTLVPFNPAVNDADIELLVCRLHLQDMIAKSSGFLYEDRQFRLLFISEKLSDREKILVLAHEIGHIVCGHNSRTAVVGQTVQDEYEANEFAHYLLGKNPAEKTGDFLAAHKMPLIGAAAVFAVLLLGTLSQRLFFRNGPEVISPTAHETEMESTAGLQKDISETPEEASAASGAVSGSDVKDNADIEILKDLHLPLSSDYVKGAFHFLVLRNNTEQTVRIQTRSRAFSEDGDLLGSASATTVPVSPGCVIVTEEDYTASEDISYFESSIGTIPASEPSMIPFLSYDIAVNQEGAVVSMTNRGSTSVCSLAGYALFFKEGRLTGCDYAFFGDSSDELKPWMPDKRQLYAPRKFDDVEFYILSYGN